MTSPATPAPLAPDFSTPDFLTPGLKLPDAPAPSLEEQLAGLRDIHLPPDVPFWPPAPGWYALAGLVLLVGLVLAIREWRWRQTLAYKALKEFEATLAQADAQEGARDGLPDAQAIAVAASGVLRRLVRAQSGNAATALTGEAWTRVLVAGKAGFGVAEAAFLARAPYYPPAAAPDAGIAPKAFVTAVRRWIRARS
ncbi:DUF4381 domain-containing protein [Xanthobacter autotrophicus]|uniref:DUF4381 domain-containing protein n=1 Tax=Xanthobacter autotrophicus TaxID=280 RepID=UPI00372B01D9